ACSGESDELFLGKFMPRKNGIGAKVISEAQKLISQGKDIETVRKESVFISSVELSPSAMDKNIKTTACFPLFFGKEILGLLYLHFKEKRDFSPEELLKIHLLVDQTAIAIKNAEQKRSSNIEAVTNRLSEKIFHQEFMQYMVHLVKKIFKARWCSCFSYNKHADTVILTASTNSRFKALIKDSKPVQYKLGQGVSGWIAKHQRVLRLIQWGDERVLKTYDSQMTWDEEYNKGENAEEMNAKSFSFMAAPLVIDKQLLGIIRVVKNGKKSFDIEDEKLLLELIPVLSLNFKNALQASILQKWLSIAAHEFCGSLAGLQFLINELNAGNLNIERQKFYLELLQGITVHFSRVVNNFSYLGRITIQSLKRYEEKKVDIEGIIKRFGILYIQHENAENKKNLRLVINNKDKLRSVNIIEEGLASIISNLMSNAVKYSMPNKEIIVNIKMENRHWACEVINKGDPIPKKIMPHLFSPPPLFIEERDGKKGLGLYIVHEWIKELGGNLKVDSTHKETKFAFTLPIKQFTRRGSNDPSNRR
ncbi:MAG: ATP-binding protein, partial [Thermodesulfobacteriota bacterium]|nr:ATP-binding protein [Thermodesulfobacteriota bacterium]